jgi:hypothetical protein
MKQETLETTSQNQIQEKNCSTRVLGINHFYKLYLKENVHRDNSLFFINEKIKSKKKRVATFKEYKKVVRCYLEIYFYELYFLKIPSYFFLLGLLKVTVSSPWSAKNKKGGYFGSDGALGLFWYLRPSERSYFMVKINKLTGKHNMLPKIEADFKKQHDKELLPTFTEERKKGLKTKTLFRCIQI